MVTTNSAPHTSNLSLRDFIRGKDSRPVNDFSPEQQLELWTLVLGYVRPILKYLSYEILKELLHWTTERAERFTLIEIEWPTGLNMETRILVNITLAREAQPLLLPPPVEGETQQKIIKTHLLLTSMGIWLYWEDEFNLFVSPPKGARLTTVSCRFREVRSTDLLNLITLHPTEFLKAICGLKKSLEKTIGEREKALSGLRRNLGEINGLTEKLIFPVQP